MVAQDHNHAASGICDPLHCCAQGPSARIPADAEEIAKRVRDMYAYQRDARFADRPMGERQVNVAMHMIFVHEQPELTELRLHALLGYPLD